ncbi:MAG: NAD-dependent epimerase/dehydratase family protein, partial [Planctomycetales bacterium]|nr:NAD-dependent epimerase/dehydratase family protein [Planctomycetales bacterium]
CDTAAVRQAVEDCDVVFHLAGSVKALQPETMLKTNVEGTRVLATACAARPTPPTLVLTSSLAAAGPSPAGQPRREGDRCQPVSVYGRSKRDAELVLEEFAQRLPASVVRPPIVFGPRDQGMLAMFKAIRRTRMHLLPGYRRRTYSLIHAADLVEALLRVATQGSRLAAASSEGGHQGYYYVADDQQLTYGQLGSMITRALGGRWVLNLPMPEWSVWLSAWVNDQISRRRGEAHVLNIDKAREATAGSWTCSAEKIERELGFHTAAPLAERMQETASWYRAEGLL